MSLTTGTKLGPCEIVAPLRAGGLGEVYRAHDSRFGREVGVKVELFAPDAMTGQRTLVREIGPRDTVGVAADIRLTPDGESYAYVRSLFSLYQVTGLE